MGEDAQWFEFGAAGFGVALKRLLVGTVDLATSIGAVYGRVYMYIYICIIILTAERTYRDS